jgi:hypothetical protein
MIIKHIKPNYPLDYDPWEEDCCGAYSAETLIIDEDREAKYPDGNNIKITIQEYKSGIGDSFKITVEGKGKSKTVFTEVNDNGDFNFEVQGCDL